MAISVVVLSFSEKIQAGEPELSLFGLKLAEKADSSNWEVLTPHLYIPDPIPDPVPYLDVYKIGLSTDGLIQLIQGSRNRLEYLDGIVKFNELLAHYSELFGPVEPKTETDVEVENQVYIWDLKDNRKLSLSYWAFTYTSDLAGQPKSEEKEVSIYINMVDKALAPRK